MTQDIKMLQAKRVKRKSESHIYFCPDSYIHVYTYIGVGRRAWGADCIIIMDMCLKGVAAN